MRSVRKKLTPFIRDFLRRGGGMFRRREYLLKPDEATFFFSDLNRLISGSMTVEELCCEQCGKLEFFDQEITDQP